MGDASYLRPKEPASAHGQCLEGRQPSVLTDSGPVGPRAAGQDGPSAQPLHLLPQSTASVAGTGQGSGLALPHLLGGAPSQGSEGRSTLDLGCLVGNVAVTGNLSTPSQLLRPPSFLSLPPTTPEVPPVSPKLQGRLLQEVFQVEPTPLRPIHKVPVSTSSVRSPPRVPWERPRGAPTPAALMSVGCVGVQAEQAPQSGWKAGGV